MMPDNARKSWAAAWAFRALQLVARGARGIIINNHAQTAEQIRAQVDALAPLFEFISYDELKERLLLNSGRKPFCLLTFDDGKAINATEAAPELVRLGVPAVFFIVTGAVGSGKALWFDRLTALRNSAGKKTLPDYSAFEAMPWRDREQQIDALCTQFGEDANLEDDTVRLMSWDEITRLQRAGFEIGSHTVNHALLPDETVEEATRQISDSIRQIEEAGLRCRTFAFPKGRARQPLVEVALKLGLESTLSTVPVWVRDQDRLGCLPRIYLRERADALHVRTKAIAARTGWMLKNPSGEGRRYGLSAT